MGKGLSNYKNWRQSVITLKQEMAGADLYYSKTYSSFRWLVTTGYQGMAECPATVIAKTITFVCSEMPKVPRETWVLPYTNQTQYQKLISLNLIFLKDNFVCTFSNHFESIDISKKSLKHAFAPRFASNSCSC